MLKTPEAVIEEEVVSKPLDTRVPAHIRILNGSLDDDPTSPGTAVLNGRIDPETLRFLKVDEEYQRPLGSRQDIFDALKAGTVVPNIEIGIRGHDYEIDGNDFIVRAPAYIIDGWQRVGTALKILEQSPQANIRMFASCHFGTDTLWERHRFTELNKNVRKVSPNLHLRNMRDQNRPVLTLFGLSNNTKDFPLYKKVCWSQNMRRGEFISALNLARVSCRLHGHLSGAGSESRVSGVAAGIEKAAAKISLPLFRQNVSAFFETLDECWPINQIEYRHAAPQLKNNFLLQVAKMFSLHLDFWKGDDKTFFVTRYDRQKLAKFPLNDPHVKSLVGSGGGAKTVLYELLLKHMNSGRSANKLTLRY